MISSFDIDGVLDFEGLAGVRPNPDDVIITGRSFEETESTLKMLHARGIFNKVYFNSLPFESKTRITSGQHKGHVIQELIKERIHQFHFEDDEIQIEEILKIAPTAKIVHVKSNFVELENKRRL